MAVAGVTGPAAGLLLDPQPATPSVLVPEAATTSHKVIQAPRFIVGGQRSHGRVAQRVVLWVALRVALCVALIVGRQTVRDLHCRYHQWELYSAG